jgi:hypothetical protein
MTPLQSIALTLVTKPRHLPPRSGPQERPARIPPRPPHPRRPAGGVDLCYLPISSYYYMHTSSCAGGGAVVVVVGALRSRQDPAFNVDDDCQQASRRELMGRRLIYLSSPRRHAATALALPRARAAAPPSQPSPSQPRPRWPDHWPRPLRLNISLFLDKNRRYIGKSQSKRPPKRTQRLRTRVAAHVWPMGP